MKVVILSALLMLGVCSGSQILSVITPDESTRIAGLFHGKYSDLESAYYSIAGLKSLTSGGAVGSDEKESACGLVKDVDATSITALGFAGRIEKELQCGHVFSQEAIDLANSQLSTSTNMPTIYSAVNFLTSISQPVDGEQVIEKMSSSVSKVDNSVLMSSLAVSAASKLSLPSDSQQLADFLGQVDIKDMSAQGDEVDSKYLHMENSLEVTSIFLDAVMSLSQSTQQSPTTFLSSNQLVMLSNYLLRSKSSVSSAKDASLIVVPLGKIVASKHVKVAKGELVSGTSVSENRPNIQLSFTNLFSQPITDLGVKADSMRKVGADDDDEVLFSNAPFAFDGLRLYELQVWEKKPRSGFYHVSLSVESANNDEKLIGLSSLEFRLKVTAKIVIKNVQLGTAEKDQATGSLKSINYPGKAPAFKADKQQRVVMSFQVEDSSTHLPITPHQVFVRFNHRLTNQDVIFVAEVDENTSVYKFEVDLATASKEQFHTNSGLYSLSLIVGDATISNPVNWNFCDVTLRLGSEGSSSASMSKMEELYTNKEEIVHKFRQPEKRPPLVTSQAFTLAALLPLLLLLVAWRSVGANLNGIKLAPKNIIFHLGLTGIFVLYYMFWTKLNMFETVQYLFGVGSITFVFGNMVLSEMANN